MLGDGIRYNIASVDPAERALLCDALIELNNRLFPGDRDDSPPGGVSWRFKQDGNLIPSVGRWIRITPP